MVGMVLLAHSVQRDPDGAEQLLIRALALSYSLSFFLPSLSCIHITALVEMALLVHSKLRDPNGAEQLLHRALALSLSRSLSLSHTHRNVGGNGTVGALETAQH